MSKNKIQILPSEFGDLSALEDLRLDNNLVIIVIKVQRIFFQTVNHLKQEQLLDFHLDFMLQIFMKSKELQILV